MDLHRFRTQNVLFIYFSKKVTFYLNIYCNLKYNLMYSCNLSAPIPLAVYLLGSIMPSPCIINNIILGSRVYSEKIHFCMRILLSPFTSLIGYFFNLHVGHLQTTTTNTNTLYSY